jgi:hypothetical protein
MRQYTSICMHSHRLVCLSLDWLCFIPTSRLQQRQRSRSIGLGAADMHNGHAAICSSQRATATHCVGYTLSNHKMVCRCTGHSACSSCFVFFGSIKLAAMGKTVKTSCQQMKPSSCVCECHVKRVKLVSEAVERLQHCTLCLADSSTGCLLNVLYMHPLHTVSYQLLGVLSVIPLLRAILQSSAGKQYTSNSFSPRPLS